jgi:hypothetical protein
MDIYLHSSDQWFGFYDFLHGDGFDEKLQFWTDCSDERKIKSGAIQVGFFPWIEYQKVGKLSQLSVGYIYSLIGPTV